MRRAFRRKLQHNLHQNWRRKRFKEQEGRCCYCGCEMLMDPQRYQQHRRCTLEHRVPISRGGADHWENTAASCAKCNKAKGSMTDDEFRQSRAPSPLPSPVP